MTEVDDKNFNVLRNSITNYRLAIVNDNSTQDGPFPYVDVRSKIQVFNNYKINYYTILLDF